MPAPKRKPVPLAKSHAARPKAVAKTVVKASPRPTLKPKVKTVAKPTAKRVVSAAQSSGLSAAATLSKTPRLRLAGSGAAAPPSLELPKKPEPSAHMPRPGEDKQAWFSRIAQQYYRFLFATALPIVRRADDAEDVVQAAVLNGLRRLDQLDDPGAIIGWLAMITRNAALDFLRRKKRIPGGGGDVTVLPIAAPESDKEQYRMEDDLRSILTAAIATLPPNQQEVVNLRHFEGLEISQIATRLSITENNARVRLFRSYEHLRHNPKVRQALGLADAVPEE